MLQLNKKQVSFKVVLNLKPFIALTKAMSNWSLTLEKQVSFINVMQQTFSKAKPVPVGTELGPVQPQLVGTYSQVL